MALAVWQSLPLIDSSIVPHPTSCMGCVGYLACCLFKGGVVTTLHLSEVPTRAVRGLRHVTRADPAHTVHDHGKHSGYVCHNDHAHVHRKGTVRRKVEGQSGLALFYKVAGPLSPLGPLHQNSVVYLQTPEHRLEAREVLLFDLGALKLDREAPHWQHPLCDTKRVLPLHLLPRFGAGRQAAGLVLVAREPLGGVVTRADSRQEVQPTIGQKGEVAALASVEVHRYGLILELLVFEGCHRQQRPCDSPFMIRHQVGTGPTCHRVQSATRAHKRLARRVTPPIPGAQELGLGLDGARPAEDAG
eukprot:Hpha_TRINITY_DN12498_c0_g1::TRINITY_DN12498_c0_g1_i1::g.42655::m.42655